MTGWLDNNMDTVKAGLSKTAVVLLRGFDKGRCGHAQELAWAVLADKTSNIDWQAGDVSIIHNMRWMHGRAPFTGTRRVVLAAMGLPQSITE